MIETTILIALIGGLTEVAKSVGLEKRWLPLLAIVLGVGLNLFIGFIGYEIGELIIAGLIAGLSTMGLYDIGKKTILGR